MVDANYGMRGPAISQQQIGGQNPPPLEQTSKASTKTSPLDQTYENKFNRSRRLLTYQQRSSTTATLPCQTPSSSSETSKSTAQLTYEQAKASVKARKRKERQESVTSICQERKVIRSNSEERPTNNKNNIRRVSSHEDFNKSNNKEEPSTCQAHFQKKDNFVDLECEFEKRRSYERFSRPLAQRNKYISQSRRPRSKHFSKKDKNKRNNKSETERRDPASNSSEDNEVSCQFLQLCQKEKERSPSPICTPISPALDLTTLHQQIDCTEPLPSTVVRQMPEENETLTSLSMTSTRLLSSPRNSVIITERIYLNPDIPQTISAISNETKNPLEYRQKQVSKQIDNVKKKIKKYDEEFLTSFGYRPSHADKLNNKDMKKLCGELSRLKKEHTGIVENSACFNDKEKVVEVERTGPILKDTLHEIEKKLDSKRQLAERNNVIEEMTNEQLVEEKIAIQKALLFLESRHGRPTFKEDKDLARPLYDRYRLLKRIVAKLNVTNNIVELATIHEHETMDFVAVPPSNPSINIEHTSSNEKRRNTFQQPLTSSPIPANSTTDSSDTDTSIGENFHALTLEELFEQQKNTNEEKKQLRRTLKEFEHEFQEKMGRRVQREDKMIMEEVYQSYKNTKAKLKLLDALVGKQSL